MKMYRWILRNSSRVRLVSIGIILIIYHALAVTKNHPATLTTQQDQADLEQNDKVKEVPISITTNVQSTWSCSGDMNHEHGWHRRTCAFKNICYDKKKKVFQFYRAPGSVKQPVLFEPKQGHIYEFNMNNHGFVGLVARAHDKLSWGPTIVEQLLPSPSKVPYLEPVHVLFQHWQVSYNPGHAIWEDVAATYFAMVRLNEYDRNAVLLEYLSYPDERNALYHMYKMLIPAFASKIDSLDHYMNLSTSSIVCFRTIVAGGATPMFSLDQEQYTHGKEPLLFEYRSAILKYHGVDLSRPPTKHRILLVNKTRALRRSLRGIKNLNEVAKFIRTTYPNIKLDIVVLHELTFDQQIRELYNTTILITPCGGVSSIVPFLPKGAHAIIMDYYVNNAAYIKGELWEIGESASMDAAIWNYFPHIRKLYYQVRGKEDYVLDFVNASNTRHEASIIVKMPRLKELIDTAIANSGSASIH